MQPTEHYKSEFKRLEGTLAGQGQGWLAELRRGAIERFAAAGFPTTKHEEWKYTNVGELAKQAFIPVVEPRPAEAAAMERVAFAALRQSAPRAVFVNGIFSAEHSKLDGLPEGVRVRSLREALATEGDRVREHLEEEAGHSHRPFAELNTAFLHDGLYVHVPRGVRVEAPLYVLFFGTAGEGAAAANPRNMIVVDEGAELNLVEHYAGEGGRYFTNAVEEIHLRPAARLRHTKIEAESAEAFHIAAIRVRQDRDAHYLSTSIAVGGAIGRTEIRTELRGENSDCRLNGLYLTHDSQILDHHTVIDHRAPHTTSREIYKGVLDGKSRGVFTGKVLVQKAAQKTDAAQSNPNLLLSGQAIADSRPQLEIYADDVKCAHGATVGRIDPEQLFYLRQRGIDEAQARALLVEAFADEVIAAIEPEAVREDVRALVRRTWGLTGGKS